MRKIANISKVTRRGYRPPYKIYNLKWEFHQCDVDPAPSVPHGHSIEGNSRLSIWDGIVYPKTGGRLLEIGKIRKKELKNLRSDVIFTAFVKKTRKWYLEEFGYCPELKNVRPVHDYSIYRQENIPEKIIVTLPVILSSNTMRWSYARIKLKPNHRKAK